MALSPNDWNSHRRKRNDDGIGWGPTLILVVSFALYTGYKFLDKVGFEIRIGHAPQPTVTTMSADHPPYAVILPPAPQQPAQAMPVLPPQPSYPPRAMTATPAPTPAPHKKSNLEIYQGASRIYETADAEAAAGRAWAPAQDPDQEWLHTMDKACDPFGRGSVQERQCRVNCKLMLQQVCTGEAQSFRPGPICNAGGLATAATPETRCFVARNYRIVAN